MRASPDNSQAPLALAPARVPVAEGIDEVKSNVPPPRDRRFKLSRACDRCRRRRIKCDEGHPCQSCLASNSGCTFEESGKRAHSHRSKRTATLEDRMHHLESLIQSIPFNWFNAQAGAGAVLPSGVFESQQSVDTSNSNGGFVNTTHAYPLGVPPPSLSLFPLMNPSTHFPSVSIARHAAVDPSSSNHHRMRQNHNSQVKTSYLYLDDEGFTRWQGETSGLPLLDFLVERELPSPSSTPPPTTDESKSTFSDPKNQRNEQDSSKDWFPNRTPNTTSAVHPETMWRLITSMIAPELMDSLVQCFLSTSYYLLPFLHVPTFLEDYGNPVKWGELGFAAFVVSICCLSSRHVDDLRVRANPHDGVSAGSHWFELFTKLRTMPSANKPTLYNVQAVFISAVYAIGLGRLSRGFALLAEAVTLSVDAGLHRSSEAYDCFDPIEEQVRRRTFWCIYMWDKQAAAAFGRPPLLRFRDCDVPEPAEIDDEHITRTRIGPQPTGQESRLGAFIACARLCVLLESVLDSPQPQRPGNSAFLKHAENVLVGQPTERDLHVEESLLDELLRGLSPYWAHTTETMSSPDVLRVTQAERLHCLEQFVRMMIHRHRFSRHVAARTLGGKAKSGNGREDAMGIEGMDENGRIDEDQLDAKAERDAMLACHTCAIRLVNAHMQVAQKGLMTYYGVHVIHQLSQTGRTLIAVLLNCKTEDLQPLVQQSLETLRSCIGLLRRFSTRYVCGLRQGELIEEFCRLTRIPLDTPIRIETKQLPPWHRPLRKRKHDGDDKASSSGDSRHGSPETGITSPSTHSTRGARASPDSPSGIRMTLPSGPYTMPHLERRPGSLLADLQETTSIFGLPRGTNVNPTTINNGSNINNFRGYEKLDVGSTINGIDVLESVVADGSGRATASSDVGAGSGMDGINAEMDALSTSALVTMLNDGSFDMNALFNTEFETSVSPDGAG